MADIGVGQRPDRPGIRARIGSFLEVISSSSLRIRRVEHLNAMSDEDLARLGIRREDIVRHVFRDVM